MDQGIVFAKTARPSAAGVLARERLFAWLDDATVSPLVWVQAPAGAGKTSAVVSYLESRKRRGLWYQIDASDSDPATFFAHLARAFSQGHRLPMFTAEYRDAPAAFAMHFFRSLVQAQAGEFVLVVDDYHELDADAPLHALLRAGINELPPECGVVVVSRESPPSAFIRLRANRALRVLTWSQLKLTEYECAQIVNANVDDVDAHRLRTIYEKTQGWAAAVILMLEHERLGHRSNGVSDGYEPELLFNYLAEEVFDQLEPAMRRLLLVTAGVREMTGDLAIALIGDESAAHHLRLLAQQHHLLSVTPGSSGDIYRSHPLLRSFLMRKAAETIEPNQRRELALAAARYLEGDGALDVAYSMLSQAGAYDMLVAFVLRHARETLREGRADTLLAWIDELPHALAAKEPWIDYWRACCEFETNPLTALGTLGDAYARFDDRAIEKNWDVAALSVALAMEAAIYARHELAVLDEWIPRALALAAQVPQCVSIDANARLVVGLFMAMVFRQPHRAEIKDWAERAFAAIDRIDDASVRTGAQLLMAINLSYTGQFERAKAFIEMLRPLTNSSGATPLALTTMKTVESMYHMLMPEPAQCLQVALDGMQIGEDTGVQVWSYHLLVNGAAGALANGDVGAASELLDRLRPRTARAGYLDRTLFHYLEAWCAMLAGRVVDAHREQTLALDLAIAAGCPFYEALCHLAQADVMCARGEHRRALHHVRRTRELAKEIDNRLLHFACLTVAAHIAIEVGREGVARRLLAVAFAIGRENGFVHFLWWRPQVVARLSSLAIEHHVEPDYVRMLVRRRRLELPSCARDKDIAWPWQFEIHSFGRFEVHCDGTALTRLSGKPLGLLKALVGAGGEEVREETLTRSLWPRVDRDCAQRSFTTALHRLRKMLGQDRVLVLQHGRLTLARELCWLDIREFDHAVAAIEGEDALAWGGDEQCLNALAQRLFCLYRGPFMASESEAEDAIYRARRERARHHLLSALDALARRWQALGQPARVPLLYAQAEELDPLAEGFYRRHMLCLRALGQAAQAVEVFARLRSILAASKALQPTPETQAIYAAVVKDL